MSKAPRTRHHEQSASIQAILAELPEDHPARAAYRSGADAIALTSFVERDDLVEKLNQAWLDWYSVRLRQQLRRG